MSVALVWLRRDLRCRHNPALIAATHAHSHVIVLYVHDKASPHQVVGAQRWWLHYSLLSLKAELLAQGLYLTLRQGDPLELLLQFIKQHRVTAVYWNRCYEPQIIARDQHIKQHLRQQGIQVSSSNSQLLVEPWEIKTQTGEYFKVFTPFWKQCLKQLVEPKRSHFSKDFVGVKLTSDRLNSWQLLPRKPNWAQHFSEHWTPGEQHAQTRLRAFITTHLNDYKEQRNFPAQQATSKLSPHLHFGEISPWDIWRATLQAKQASLCNQASADHFLSELGWREFSYHLLYHVPDLSVENFKPAFNAFPWSNSAKALAAWQRGLTGYPLVDAGMRELWATGFMHNRVRMLVASFLTKDLLIDWRLGADWFLETLVDADCASNSAGWQWVAGCGADAAPYFRIFNPVLQGEKFDANGDYVRLWVPELASVERQWIHKPWLAPEGMLPIQLGTDYPLPLVDHDVARKRALSAYQAIKG